MTRAPGTAGCLYTIGHSTRPIDEFLDLLFAYDVELLVDVRTIPKSRQNPQFNRESLCESLENAKIAYEHMASLGGLRKAKKDSPNIGWRNPSFQGFADYMQTDSFLQGLEDLMQLARARRTAIMCSEAVPWRCHRSLIADALLIRGWQVDEIIGLKSCREHKLTPFAKVQGLKITYPPADSA